MVSAAKDSSAQASSRLRDALNHAMVLNDRRARLSRDRRRIGTFWLVIRLGLLGTELLAQPDKTVAVAHAGFGQCLPMRLEDMAREECTG